ncbi:MAG TPA: NADH:flavin oxidoreductase/NADH oxidase, partial [Kiloniellales bacterium]
MPESGSALPKLFTPIELRGVTARNRVVISPMCQYSAKDGIAGEWHFAHLAKFALGGAGIVFTEAAAVEARGRITHGDVGIWSDAHAEALAGIAGFLKAHGAVPAIQLAHAG